MKLDLSEFFSTANKDETFQVQYDLDDFSSKMGTFPILRKEPFSLRITNDENRRLLISGETEVTLGIPCDRCLEEVEIPVSVVIDKSIPLKEETDDDETAGYMEECELDADRLIYAEILVNYPAKVLCREDCKGICIKCGTNLNLHTCDCDRVVLDPRMAAFQDVFNSMKK